MNSPIIAPPLRTLVLCLLVGFLPINVTSQQDDTQRRRAMFVNKAADGLEIKILKKHDDEFLPIAPSHEFKADDEIRINFHSNFEGHVYFVNVAPSGETRVIHHTSVTAEKENELPAAPDGIQFDKEVGIEVLKIVMAREAIPVFDEALKSADGFLGKTPASVAQELRTRSVPVPSGKKDENVGIVQPNNDPGARCRGLHLATGDKFRCRGLVLASGNPQANQGTVAIAMPDDPKEKNADGKLKPGDVVVIDLRLKHVE